MPCDQDILHSTVKTTGIVETKFTCKDQDIRFDFIFDFYLKYWKRNETRIIFIYFNKKQTDLIKFMIRLIFLDKSTLAVNDQREKNGFTASRM